MLTLTNQTTNSAGTVGYIYTIQGEPCVSVAERIIQYADERFSFQGRIGTKIEPIDAAAIPSILGRNGQVAANCSYRGVSVNVAFYSTTQLYVAPANGSQELADEVAGVGFDDGFGFDDVPSSPSQGLAMGGAPDPRSGSRRPQGSNRPPQDYDDFSDAAFQNGRGGPTPADPGQTVGIGEWILTFILLAIPIVNLIMLIVWLIGKKTKKSKKNYLIAQIIMMLIATVLSIGVVFLVGSQLSALLQSAGISGSGISLLGSNSNTNANGTTTTENVIENISGSNANSNSNSNSNSNGNTSSMFSNSNANSNAASQASATPQVLVNINAADFQILDDGNALAILTATVYNQGTEAVIPSQVLRVQANQGTSTLQQCTTATDMFSASTFDAAIPAQGNGVCQFAFYLAKDEVGNFNQQKVHVVVQNEYTLAQLAEGEY